LIRAAGFVPRLVGRGERVSACTPASGGEELPGTIVTLQLGGDRTTGAATAGADAGAGEVPDSLGPPMPDLRGLSLRDALLRVRSLGARPQVAGSGWVLGQRPEPGAPVAARSICCLTLGPDSSRAFKEYLESEQSAAWAAAAGDFPRESPR
jgi:hypothetical protein